MPPKRNNKNTQKDKRTGRKQKNTTFKKGGASKTLTEIVKDKLEENDYKLIQQLIDNPHRKYAILIDFCEDNKFVVNTDAFLSHTFLSSDKRYENYNNKLTIPKDFEKGKLLKIVIYANEYGIQYNTDVKDNESRPQTCNLEELPVIYHIPEITTLDDKELLSSTTLAPSVPVEQQSDEVDLDDVPRYSIPYDEEITSPDDVVEQAQINMNDLVVEDLEDVTDIDSNINVSSPPDDLSKELEAKIKEEEKEKAKKEEKEIDRLEHEARLKAEEERKRQEEENIDDDEEMWFEDVSDDEAKKEQESEKLFQKYTDEINIISGILQSIMMSGNISSDKTHHRNDYTPALGQLKTKYEALIDIFNKDDTTHIPIKTKNKIIDVLTNNHRRLQALRTYDRGTFGTGLKFESNFMEKVKDSLSIMNTLKTYFKTFDESLMTNLGNKPQVSYDYTKKVDGGKKTRKNRRKTKRRKTKKRI